jgi:hypothetical protein
MRILYRWPISFLGACLASVGASAGLCGWAGHQSAWPRYADFVCGHNAPLPWLVSVPVLTFALNLLLLGRRNQSSENER